MAFFGNSADKVDAPRRSAPGVAGIAFPVTGLPEVGLRLPGCAGCSKASAHNPCSGIAIEIPHGEHRYERVPIANRQDIAGLNRLQAQRWLLGWIAWGYIGDAVLYNAGAANNASQFVDYEVTAASGTTLTLKGPNPKRIVVATSRLNPDWPFPDPVTGQPGRIVTGQSAICLPVGSAVEFRAGSVLEGKLVPYIKTISPPASEDLDDVTFTVEVSADVSNARHPADAFYPPADGKYWARVRFEALFQDTWGNWQAPKETSYFRRTATVTTGGTLALTRSDNSDGRVLWPDMMEGALTVELVPAVGDSVMLSTSEVAARLTTTDPAPGEWASELDLSGLGIGTTFVEAVIVWHAEALAGDTPRVQFAGSCANSQREPSGSYAHIGEHRCCAVDSTGFATYRGQSCWKPGACDHFAIGDAGHHYGGPMPMPPSDLGDPSYQLAANVASSWFVEQGMPGVSSSRNFQLSKPSPGGPSLEALCGGAQNSVPGGYFPSRVLFNSPAFGQRVTWTDGDGNQRQALVFGAFFREPTEFLADEGPDYRWTAGTTPALGCIASSVAGWTAREDARGNAMASAAAAMPARLQGRCGVYDYASGVLAMGRSNATVRVQRHCTGIDLSGDGDTALAAEVAARFA